MLGGQLTKYPALAGALGYGACGTPNSNKVMAIKSSRRYSKSSAECFVMTDSSAPGDLMYGMCLLFFVVSGKPWLLWDWLQVVPDTTDGCDRHGYCTTVACDMPQITELKPTIVLEQCSYMPIDGAIDIMPCGSLPVFMFNMKHMARAVELHTHMETPGPDSADALA